MKHFLLVFLWFFSVNFLLAQTSLCDKLINDGNENLRKKNYSEAMKCYLHAIEFHNDCKVAGLEGLKTCMEEIKNLTLIKTSDYSQMKKKADGYDNAITESYRLKQEIDSLYRYLDGRNEQRDNRNRQRAEDDINRKGKENTFICEHIKDNNFRLFLLKHRDEDGDGKISQYEAELIKNLDITRQNISSLEGIEYFINLERLVCTRNQLKKLDLSKNTLLRELKCNRNAIEKLDISNCLDLTILDCSQNQLTNLCLKNNKKIKNLNCAKNKLTGELAIANNIELDILKCDLNQISNIDVSNCTSLRIIECQNNSISKLDISTNINLIELNCSFNKLNSLSLKNNKKMKRLNCSFNQLTSLEVNKESNFDLLNCSSNSNLSEIIVGKSQDLTKVKKSNKTILRQHLK